MSSDSYSQLGQDNWILSKFEKDYKGFYVEIGASEGVFLSDTYLLELNGWDGVCIEPGKEQFKKLEETRKSKNFNYAITDYDGKCDFNENKLWGMIRAKNVGTTDCFTLKTFLDNINAPKVIDYLSIDVEGEEYNIIKDFPFDEYYVKYITVEHNANGSGPELKNKINSVLSPLFVLEKEDVGGFEDWYTNKLV